MAGAGSRQERPDARPPAPRAARPDPPGLPARPRPHHPLQGLPAPEAQDPGLLRADGRPLPDAPHAHARGVADRAQHRQGAPPARGADRGHRARARPRPHAVRPRGRARAPPAHAGRLQPLRAEPAHRGRPRERPPGAQPDLGGARRHRPPLQGAERDAGRGRARAPREHRRGPGRAGRRHHRLREPRHRRCRAGWGAEARGPAAGAGGDPRAHQVRAHRADGDRRGHGDARRRAVRRSA